MKSRGCIVCSGMLRVQTPVEKYPEFGLWVKREDLACPPPGPPFSKTRGVYSRLLTRPESVIGVLDTRHSQAGHAVARACQVLGKHCICFYPMMKYAPEPKESQIKAAELGAELRGLKGWSMGPQQVLFHIAKKQVVEMGGYMMPNALTLEESVEETANEVPNAAFDRVIVSVSSGTLAAGVIRGFERRGKHPQYLLHLGYSKYQSRKRMYLNTASGFPDAKILLIDENYAYKDQARPGITPPWPCNEYYDLKAFRWWVAHKEEYPGRALFWNIG